MGAPQDGDIVIEYHPHSGKDTRILDPEDFKWSIGGGSDPTEPIDDEPWLPFSSREDFTFAEGVIDAKLNKKQTKTFLDLINRCQTPPGLFTLRNYKDLKDTLDTAAELLTDVSARLPSLDSNNRSPWIHRQFEPHEVVCEFDGKNRTYETWSRDLWGWILDHLTDPELVRHFEWDAQKVFRVDDKGNRTRVFTEPWTGKRFWDVQVNLFNPFYCEVVLIHYKDVAASRRENGLPRTLCRQEQTLVVWETDGVPCNGEDS
jgi:hypothetical protein